MKDKILVVGGYGHVGQTICRDLGEKFPGKVIAAGRNYKKARKFSLDTNGKVKPLKFDLFKNKENNEVLEDVFVVIMCIDQKDTKFIETCIKSGTHYIDVTASYSFFSKVEKLNNTAQNSDSTVILSVGLSPGLTNLLVQHSKSHFDTLNRADINVMLGLGDEHGKAAMEWMVGNMNKKFEVVENGSLRRVRSFEDGKTTDFPGKFGRRSTYRFDFAEQHVLPKTLDINTVSNRICFDSSFMTKSFAFLKKIGALNLLKFKLLKNIFIKILERFNYGSDIFIAQVDALGEEDGKSKKFQCSIMGNKESRITGEVAAVIAKEIYTQKHLYPSGVYHIEQIVNCSDIIDQLKEKNSKLSIAF